MKKFDRKITTLILICTFVFSPILALPAQAQWVVFDASNFVQNTLTSINTTAQTTKEFGLDAVAWVIVNLIIERMAASTVKWINSGFKGSPAYVTNPEAYFQDIGDKIAGQYIFSDPNLNFLCGPISAKIRLALTSNYITDRNRWQCTLTDAVGNMEDFMDDFDRGGWDKFFELTQRQQNNPIGAYLQAENELNAQIATRQGTKKAELDWGGGFMSFKECEQYGVAIPERRIPLPGGGSQIIPASPGPCMKEKTNTPGSVISNQLNKQLGMGQDKLAVADEINEIVSALLNQLVKGVIGGIGKGLRGLSESDPTNNNKTFTSQLTDSTAASTEDYFGNTTDTSILDVPVPNLYDKPADSELTWPDKSTSAENSDNNAPFQP